jgi:hypothetical protein
MLKLLKFISKRKRKSSGACPRGCVPVVRRTLSANGGGYIQNIIGATQPGKQKLQFPYELPVIKTEVALEPSTQKVLIGVASGIALGSIASALIKRAKN